MMKEFNGRVVRKRFGEGSKSEHDGVYLRTASGQYLLRRPTGNPFFDPELESLVGRTIHCIGEIEGYTLFIEKWDVKPG